MIRFLPLLIVAVGLTSVARIWHSLQRGVYKGWFTYLRATEPELFWAFIAVEAFTAALLIAFGLLGFFWWRVGA